MRLKNKHTLFIVTGGPGTGKSYAARQICAEIEGVEVLSYDSVKEKEWDRFGFDNASQKARLNRFCLEEFYLILQKMMWSGKTILIEYPFHHGHREQLSALIEQYQYQAITILLYGDWKIIYERGQSRDNAGRRHPGHLTNTYHIEKNAREEPLPDAALTYDQFRADIDRKNYDIQLGTTISVDVTDFSKIHFRDILRKIAQIDAT